MKITDLKINGITNPVGFAYEKILCSWKVTDTSAKKQKEALIEVSRRKDFGELEHVVSGAGLKSNETEITFSLQPYTTYYWRVKITGENGESAVSETAFFETAKRKEPWQAVWIGPAKEDTFHPVLEKKFDTAKKAVRARLYICGVGLYEAYVNGKKAGNDLLAPFINDYKECLQYQTYDVTEEVTTENELRIYLAKGWYMGRFGLEGKEHNFGDRMAAIAELHICYEDGSTQVIATDESWQYRGSDIEDSGIYFGEILNRQLWCDRENPMKPVEKIAIETKLMERYSLPVVVKERITPVEIIHTPAGETVLDMGQNFAGMMEFMADFPAGTKIVIQCGEILQQGIFYHENYREAESTFTYISDGRKELVRPHFTYFGYRYLKVEGWPGELHREDITGLVVYSDLERTGFIETSNEKINRLYENCLWSQKSNFIDMPTDCPQRSERLGWTGDAQVFAPTACYNMDTRAFFHKFLRDLRSEQLRCEGGVPNYIPNLETFGGACSVWGDVATFLPANVYEKFGNIKEMEAYYPLMKDWVDYMTRVDEENGHRNMFRPGFQFGDWLALDGVTEQSFKGSTDDDYIGAVYYYQSAKLLAEMALRLAAEADEGAKDRYEKDVSFYGTLTENIKKAVLDEYFTPNGRLSVDTQAAYIIALKFGLYRDKEVLINQFKTRLKKDCYDIKCGFVGAPLLCMTLCENGMEDLAYHFLFKESFPSWLYCVNLGATTIWERWNSLLPDGTCSGTGMNSFNHYSYGSVVEFLYAYIGGIRALEPGFKRALIAPVPDMRFRYFKARYNSACGNYVSNWKIEEDGTFVLSLEIPFDCTAEVILPRCDGKKVSGVPEGALISSDGKITLDAGTYEFSYQPTKDFRKVYDENTRLAELSGDKEAMEILQETLPQAYGMIMAQDKENMNLTLGELPFLFFMGFNPENVGKATEKLYSLLRW